MTPESRFTCLPKRFWAAVRLISQECGYTRNGQVSIPSEDQANKAYTKYGIDPKTLFHELPCGTRMWDVLSNYFKHRANVLNQQVEPNLMNADDARKEFNKLREKLNPKCPLPFNKQKGDKKAYSYLTCIVNMLIEDNAKTHECSYDPKALTTIINEGKPIRTFSRRMDGAFPSVKNPIAVWEIKEYYYTTTFGSRVADGIYETLLDGMEIEELQASESINILHYLIIDAYNTWWDKGKPYLCRLVDMLHMGYVDEVLVGREVLTRLPELVKNWVSRVST